MPPSLRITMLATLCMLMSMPAAHAQYPAACRKMYELASSAMANKEAGLTEAQLRDVLPPKDKAKLAPGEPMAEQLIAMHEILDEIFGNEGLDAQAYAVYRAEVCFRRLNKLPVPASFKESVPALRECSMPQRDAVITCAMKVAGSGSSD
jgi:hypothetical protein